MTVYRINFDGENYRKIGPVRESDLDGRNLWVDGSLKLSSWKAPAMEYSEKENPEEKIADITRITPGFYAFNQKAINTLGGILKANGELLEFSINDEVLHAFNPHNEIDCLDHERSKWKIRRNGKIGRLLKPAFDVSQINNIDIFQIPELLQTAFFVTDTFISEYHNAGLSGLLFEPC